MNTSATQELLAVSQDLGFEIAGVCPAITPTGFHRFTEWVARGYGGEMHYLADRQEAYRHPQSVLNGVKSIVMLAMNYHTVPAQDRVAGAGRIARYAWGEVDYHDLIHKQLKQFKLRAAEILPTHQFRGVVDTAPLLEREFAQLAGLGWIGKNTLLLNKQYGSYFFLAALLTDAELHYDAPFEAMHCGTCTACLESCPTQAFPEPFVLDARRCISYLTIEHRSDFPDDLKGTWDDWLFGCDVCQEVCPWNRDIPVSQQDSFQPQGGSTVVDLIALFYLDDQQFRQRFRKTPLWRSKRRGVLRNAALLLGTQKHKPATAALERGAQDADELIHGACRWALGQIHRQ